MNNNEETINSDDNIEYNDFNINYFDIIENNYKNIRYFIKNKFNSLDVYNIYNYTNILLKNKGFQSLNNNIISKNLEYSQLDNELTNKREYIYVVKAFQEANARYIKFENSSKWFGYEISLFSRDFIIKLSIFYQVIAGVLNGVGAAVTYGVNVHQSGFKSAAIRAGIAICFYGPSYLIKIYSLLFAYHARFSPLAAQALGNMISDVLSAFLYTVFGLQAFNNELLATVVISIVFGLSSIIYAVILQLHASKLDFNDNQIDLINRILDNIKLTSIYPDGSIDFTYNNKEDVNVSSIIKISNQMYSKLFIIVISVAIAILCFIIGFSIKNDLTGSFLLQLGSASLRPIYQNLPSSLDLGTYSEFIQLVIRSLIALVFATLEFYGHLQAVEKAGASGNVVLSNSVGTLPGDLFNAFLAYKWLGECIDIPIKLAITSAFTIFITLISLQYS